ncbi:unnamed protein product [Prunus armeniaca]
MSQSLERNHPFNDHDHCKFCQCLNAAEVQQVRKIGLGGRLGARREDTAETSPYWLGVGARELGSAWAPTKAA